MFRAIINGFVDFVLPPVCLCCESPIENSYNGKGLKFVCVKCYSRLEKFNESHPWKDEMISSGVIDNSFSAFWFREGTEIQTLMHEMKYGKMKSIGRMFGREIGSQAVSPDSVRWDYIIPVPLHKAKLRDRTYNQSEFIALGINEVLKTPVLNDGIIRTRFTGTQTKLNKQQRKENVKEAFSVNPKYNVSGKNILVVDDVITTGATILECADTLKKAGAAKVWVCSAAYAELNLKS